MVFKIILICHHWIRTNLIPTQNLCLLAPFYRLWAAYVLCDRSVIISWYCDNFMNVLQLQSLEANSRICRTFCDGKPCSFQSLLPPRAFRLTVLVKLRLHWGTQNLAICLLDFPCTWVMSDLLCQESNNSDRNSMGHLYYKVMKNTCKILTLN